MSVLIVVVFASFAYGMAYFLRGVVKELVEIADEAWHVGDSEQ